MGVGGWGGLNNNQTSYVSLFSGVYMHTATGLKYIKVHIVLGCSATLWMTFLSSSLKLSVVLLSCLRKVSSHKPGLRWSPQQPLQMYILLCSMDQNKPPSRCYHPGVYWIVLTLTHTV